MNWGRGCYDSRDHLKKKKKRKEKIYSEVCVTEGCPVGLSMTFAVYFFCLGEVRRKLALSHNDQREEEGQWCECASCGSVPGVYRAQLPALVFFIRPIPDQQCSVFD